MPTVNDEFNRTCVRLDLDPERSAIFTPGTMTLDIGQADLDRFNACVAKVAPGTPSFEAEQIAGAARRLARAAGSGREPRFLQPRMRRIGEMRALLADPDWVCEEGLCERMRELVGYIDGGPGIIPVYQSRVGGLDAALLVDLAMDGLRGELDEYADFCRYRTGEAARLGVAPGELGMDRARWCAERQEELRMERQLRHGRGGSYAGKSGPGNAPFRVG